MGWNEEAARSYEEVIEQGGRVADAMRAFRTLLGGSDNLRLINGNELVDLILSVTYFSISVTKECCLSGAFMCQSH